MFAEMQRSNERSMLQLTEHMAAQFSQLREATLSKMERSSQYQSTALTEVSEPALKQGTSVNSHQDVHPAARGDGAQHPAAEAQDNPPLPAAASPDQPRDDIVSDQASSEVVKPPASETALANNDSLSSAIKDRREHKSHSKSLFTIEPSDETKPLLPQTKQDAATRKRTGKDAFKENVLFEPQTTVP